MVGFYEPLKITCEVAHAPQSVISVKNAHPKFIRRMRLFIDRYEKVNKLGKRIDELFK